MADVRDGCNKVILAEVKYADLAEAREMGDPLKQGVKRVILLTVQHPCKMRANFFLAYPKKKEYANERLKLLGGRQICAEIQTVSDRNAVEE